jgi:hypothetical protein
MKKIKSLNCNVNITEEIYLIKCFLPVSIETGSHPLSFPFDSHSRTHIYNNRIYFFDKTVRLFVFFSGELTQLWVYTVMSLHDQNKVFKVPRIF